MKLIVTILLIITLATLTLLVAAQSTRADDITDNYAAYGSGVCLYSPLNKTYTTNTLLLNLTFGKGIGMECHLKYSVDGQSYGEIPLSVIPNQELHIVTQTRASLWLPKLSDGLHYLTITVDASSGNDYQHSWTHTINFRIDTGTAMLTPTQTPTSIPSANVTNAIATATMQAPAEEPEQQSMLIAIVVVGTVIAYIAVIVILISIKGK
jgi:hypothetical protein